MTEEIEHTALNEGQSQRRASKTLIGVFLICAVASALYRQILAHGLEQTSVLFIGLPMFLGIALASTRPAKSSVGVALKSVTFALLVCGTLLGEGFICILMSAPLFYGAIGIMSLFGYFRRRDAARNRLQAVAWLPMSLMALTALEGTTPTVSLPRDETVVINRLSSHPLAAVRARLAAVPKFTSAQLPALLHLGFPLPVAVEGTGLALGDKRVISFAGGEGEPGQLALRVTESTATRIRFTVLSDSSHIAHWLGWRDTTVDLAATTDGTAVMWTFHYDRRLDPAWYFAPLERHTVGLAGAYLHDSLFGDSSNINPRKRLPVVPAVELN